MAERRRTLLLMFCVARWRYAYRAYAEFCVARWRYAYRAYADVLCCPMALCLPGLRGILQAG
ncbi:Uncharacterised protein [Citrobacter koseri]|nr:Uncharacterised protein [Citrobacter koseri]